MASYSRSAGTKAETPEISLGSLTVTNEVLLKLESTRHLKLDQVAEMQVPELAHLLRTNNDIASRVQRLARCVPQVCARVLIASEASNSTVSPRIALIHELLWSDC